MIAAMDPGIPGWVIRLGKARTVGYVLHMLHEGDITGAIRLLGQLMLGQPGYTLLTLFLILDWQAKSVFAGSDMKDPDAGRAFADADPASAPWRRHMILTRMHRRALDQADRARRHGPDQTLALGVTE